MMTFGNPVARKFYMEELWFLEQTLLSTCKSKILKNIEELKEDSDQNMIELIDSTLVKLEALTQDEFESLFHLLADHTFMPDGEWEE